MVIWRTGYRFNNTGSAQGPWSVQGYKADASVIGGPLTGETCVIPPGQLSCRFGAEGAMAPGARSERDLETPQVLYSVACFDPPGCSTANDQGFPFAGLSISGSIVTVRDFGKPAVVARGPLLAPGWRDGRPAAALRRHRPRRHPPAAGARRRRRGPRGPAAVRLHRHGARARRRRSARPRSAPRCPTAGARSASRPPTPPATSRASTAPSPSTATRPRCRSSPSSGGRRIAVDAVDPGSGVTVGTIEARGRRQRAFRPLRTSLRRAAGSSRGSRAARAGRPRCA